MCVCVCVCVCVFMRLLKISNYILYRRVDFGHACLIGLLVLHPRHGCMRVSKCTCQCFLLAVSSSLHFHWRRFIHLCIFIGVAAQAVRALSNVLVINRSITHVDMSHNQLDLDVSKGLVSFGAKGMGGHVFVIIFCIGH